MMSSPLLSLPLEVLLNITSWLDTPDYGKLRLVCSALEKQTFESFAKEFFSTKQFMITTFSLKTLLDISKDQTLNKFVNKVIIGIESLQAVHVLYGQYREALEDGIEDQRTVLACGSLQRYLSAALHNLPNCHEIEVRDFESKTKTRDDGIWRSYGSRKWRDAGGQIYNHWSSVENFGGMTVPTTIFNSVLNAIADSQIQCTSLGYVTRHDTNALQDRAFAVDALQEKAMKHSLSSVKMLAVALMSSKYQPLSQAPIATRCKNLSKFLSYMPNLTRLRINGDLSLPKIYNRHNPPDSGMPDYQLQCITEFVSVAPITRLELGKICFSALSLHGLIKALRVANTVQHLTLFRVFLGQGHWADLIDLISTIKSLNKLEMSRIFETGANEPTFHFPREIAFRLKESDLSTAPENLSNAHTASTDVAIGKDAGGAPVTTHIQSMKAALEVLKDVLVVKDRDWHKKHHLPYNGNSSDDDQGTGTENSEASNSDDDDGDASEEFELEIASEASESEDE